MLLGGRVGLTARRLLGGLSRGSLRLLLGILQGLPCLGPGGFGLVRIASQRFLGGLGRCGLGLLERLGDGALRLLSQSPSLLAHFLFGRGSLGRSVGLPLGQSLGSLIGLGLLGHCLADVVGKFHGLGSLLVAGSPLLGGLAPWIFSAAWLS